MTELLIESWIWWSVVMVIAFSRFISRRMTLASFRKFQADDWLMIIILCFYTTLIATINIVRDTDSNLLPPNFDVSTLTPENIREREYGSKLILVVEQCQCVTIWGVKGCLILLYLRLTTIHRENILIKVLGGYVVITFIVMDILYFAVWCHPFHEYWAVPTYSTQCDAATNHLITNATFNLTSDIAMILIVLPIFLRMKLEWRKKIPLILLFSLGIFTILAAVLNKVYSFSEPFGSLWTYWYVRESSTALLVANLPFVWTLWRKIPVFRTITGRSQSKDYGTAEDGSEHGSPAKGKGSDESSPEGDLGDLEMRGVPGHEERGLSFAEILGEENPASTGEKEPTPITHPQLFYGRNKSVVSKTSGSRKPSAISYTTPERHPVRHDSNVDERSGNTFGSVTYPSMTSEKSEGSFV